MTDADDLLQRALIDAASCAAVALKVPDLALSDALTVNLPRPPRSRDAADLRRPRRPRRRLGRRRLGAAARPLRPGPRRRRLARRGRGADAEQARALRDAIVAADTVLAVWAGPLAAATGSDVAVDRSIELGVKLPAHRLMPVALSAPERRMLVAAVCGARTLSQGPPPLGIVCAQQDLVHVYPLSDDPAELPRGLRGACRRPRPPHRPAARPSGGLGHALPRAQRRRLPSDGLNAADDGRPSPPTRPRRAAVRNGRVKRPIIIVTESWRCSRSASSSRAGSTTTRSSARGSRSCCEPRCAATAPACCAGWRGARTRLASPSCAPTPAGFATRAS